MLVMMKLMQVRTGAERAPWYIWKGVTANMKKTTSYTIIALWVLLGIVGAGTLYGEQNASEKAEKEQEFIAVLQSNASLHEKARACQQLALIGSRNAVSILASLLGHETMCDYARFGLEPIKDPAVDDALRDALGRLEGRQLIGVVNSIGVRRDAKAVGGLQRLVRNPDRGAVSEALMSLGMIASNDAIDTIREALEDDSAVLRSAAADAALTGAERLVDRSKRKGAETLLDIVRESDVPGHIRVAATYNAIIIRGSSGLPLLLEQLKNDNPALVAVALRAARELPGPKVTRTLAGLLPELPPKTQVLLIKVMVDRQDTGVIESIQALVASDSPEVRAESLRAFGRIGDASTAPVLLTTACSDSEEAPLALASLRMLKDEGVDEAIIAHLKETPVHARAKLIDVLSDRNATVARDAIFAEAQSPDRTVRAAAFRAIAKLAGPEDMDRAVNLLRSLEGSAGRKDAERAVISIASKIAEKSTRTDTIITAFKQETKTEARCSLLRVMAASADDKSFTVIQSSLGDENEQVKDAAVRAIAAWPASEALETVLGIFKSTDNQTHRVLALRGYVRLLRQDKQIATEKKAAILGEIIEQVDTATEKKNILSSLALIKHPSALTIAEQYLSNPQVRDEAVLATIQIAQSIAGTCPGEAKAAALEIMKTPSNDTVHKQAQVLLKTIERFEDFIVAWQVSGPYLEDGKDYSRIFDIPFAPETGDEDIEWSPMPAGTNDEKPWLLDLAKLYSGSNRIAYAYTCIHSATQQKARLELGSDDGVKVWLNGEIVHANNAARAAIPGADKVDVQLQQGWNELMLKVTQNNGPWSFCLRLCDRVGNRLNGITVDCSHVKGGAKL